MDREPQPEDGPDYHAEHAAWMDRHNGAAPVVGEWGWADGKPVHLPSYYKGFNDGENSVFKEP